MKVKIYKTNKDKRKIRVRSKISGTAEKPRMTVFRSNKFIYSQVIDDVKGKTLASVSDAGVKGKNKVEKSFEAGKKLAEIAIKAGVKAVVFDRGSYKYHGRVKALADGAREGGLKF